MDGKRCKIYKSIKINNKSAKSGQKFGPSMKNQFFQVKV